MSKAESKLEKLLNESKLLYIKEDNFILSNPINNNMLSTTYKIFLDLLKVSNSEDFIDSKIILFKQNSRNKNYMNRNKEENEEGYLKVNLRSLRENVSNNLLSNSVVAFYIEDEDRLFFKKGTTIRNYMNSMIKKSNEKTGSCNQLLGISGKEQFIRFVPKDEEKYIKPDGDFNPSEKMYLFGKQVDTENMLVMNENEFVSLMSKFANYDSHFKLKFKAIKRLMER